MFINQPDIVLDKIFSFLTVFEVQRLAWLSRLMNRKISKNSIWKNLLMRESLQYAVVSPTFAKRAVLSLNGVTLPINEYKVEFSFQLENFGEVIASGGPSTFREGRTFDFELRIGICPVNSPLPFKAIDTSEDDCDFNLKVDARYEGMVATIANANVSNWDEDHWWSENAANAGEFDVNVWIVFHFDDTGVRAISCRGPELEFPGVYEAKEEIKMSRYLERLTWKPYLTDSSEEVSSL